MSPRPPERRRIFAVALVAIALALGGVANAALRAPAGARPPGARGAPGTASPVASSVVSDGATSSAWYCAGPMPIGTPGEAASIAVTNLARRALSGEIVVSAAAGGPPSTTKLRIDPGSESVTGLTRQGPRSTSAATVLVDGSDVAVEELVHGSSGVSASPCTDHVSDVEYLAAGSTLGASNLSLSIFDPGATPAIVGVEFVTSSGIVSPPAFQGLSVDAGRLSVLDVGHYVPSKPVVATIVSATGGHVVAGASVVAVVAHAVMSSLTTGVPTTSRTWLMAGAPTGSSSMSTFNVLDPGDHAARVSLRLGSSSTSSVLEAVVPAHGVIALTPGGDQAPGAMGSADVTSTGAPVVVARETVLSKAVVSGASLKVQAAERAAAKAAAAKAAAKARKRVAHPGATTTTLPATTTTIVPYATVSALPELQPGVAVTSGVSVPATHWVLPGGESDARTSEVVVIDNTSRSVARLRLDQLSVVPGGPNVPVPIASVPQLDVAPGAVLSVNMATVVGTVPALSVLVDSNVPIVVGELLYGRKSNGLTLPTAIAVRRA